MLACLVVACEGPGTELAIADPTTIVQHTSTSAQTNMTSPPPTSPPAPEFYGSIEVVSAARLSHSWHQGCPVNPDGLRLLHVTFWGFDGLVHQGELVVATEQSEPVLDVFGQLFEIGFPIHSVIPIGDLAPDAEDEPGYTNTSGFNCRFIEGTNTWSEHAKGLAIDLNVVENPYITSGSIWPRGSDRYRDRSLGEPGMITDGDPVVAAFASIGWKWGGYWANSKDYQHFSSSGG